MIVSLGENAAGPADGKNRVAPEDAPAPSVEAASQALAPGPDPCPGPIPGGGGRARRLAVPASAEGVRLDQFLGETFKDHTRSQWKRRIEQGEVRISPQGGPSAGGTARHPEDGPELVGAIAVKPSTRLRAGDRITIWERAPEMVGLVAEAVPLEIAYEDEALIVVDKPAGLVVHPAPGHAEGTLVHRLLAHCSDLGGIGGQLRPGIVHRLDKDTSGLMVIAKNEQSLSGLQAGFRAESRTVARTYLALVSPMPSAPDAAAGKRLRIETLYGRDPANRKKFTSRRPTGKPAVTVYTVKEIFCAGSAALVEATLETGRTHQIRVHFRDRGFPILGDRMYGRLPKEPQLRAIAGALGRQALHAHKLAFTHPQTGRRVELVSALPADMANALSALRAISGVR